MKGWNKPSLSLVLRYDGCSWIVPMGAGRVIGGVGAKKKHAKAVGGKRAAQRSLSSDYFAGNLFRRCPAVRLPQLTQS